MCQKLLQPVFFMYCTFMDSDVYSADAPGSIPTLLTINVLTMQGCSMEQPRYPVDGEDAPILTRPQS